VTALRATEQGGALTIDILVQPRAPRAKLGPVVGDRLKIAVNAPPVDGEANQAVVRALAEALGIGRTAIEIVRGETGRRKTVRLRGVTLAALLRAIG
jgi:uncharacterized protein (TIGR00251 family)